MLVIVIRGGVCNLELREDTQIKEFHTTPLSPSKIVHPVKLWRLKSLIITRSSEWWEESCIKNYENWGEMKRTAS